MKLDRKSFLIGLLVATCIAAAIPRRAFFTTTSVDSAAWTSTGTNIVAQTNAAAVRTLLSITNATGLEVANLGGQATNLTVQGLTVGAGQTNSHLTASRAMVTDANKGVVSSAVTATELGYVAGVSSALQTQLDAKAAASDLLQVSNTVSTNTVTLNTTQTVAGPKNFSHAGNVFVGDGSGLTGVPSSGILTSNGLGTNTVFHASGGSNAATFVGTNGTARTYVNVDGKLISTTHLIAGNFLYLDGVGSSAYFAYVGGPILTDRGLNAAHFEIGASDTTMRRGADGLAALDNGTAGTYRDLVLRSLYMTNAYVTNLVVGGGAAVTGILSATATLNFDLTAVAVEDLTITVTGAAVGNIVTLGVPNGSVTATAQFTGWVSASDTVTVRCRTAAAGEDPASGTFRATVLKH